MEKDALRKIYLKKRNALSAAEQVQKSQLLCDQFFRWMDLSKIKVLHLYLPIQSKHEPDTWLILDRVRKEFSNIRISIPKVVDDHLASIYFEGLHQLKKNKWAILEPEQGVLTPPERIDMAIVPLLAFDTSGNRVGYGKGYYDKFLSQCRKDCQRIGLSFFDPTERIDDVNTFDIRLTGCLTATNNFIF